MQTHSSFLAWSISMDRGAWWAIAHGVAKNQTRLSYYAQQSTDPLLSTFPVLMKCESARLHNAYVLRWHS